MKAERAVPVGSATPQEGAFVRTAGQATSNLDDAAAMSQDIAKLLSPSSIAIVGASQDTDKFGGRLIEVLQLHGFPGKIYPINPKRSEIFGLKAYPRLGDVEDPVDLAVLCVPQQKVLDAVDDCAAKGVALCIVISSKFAEAGSAGEELEARLLEKARQRGVRILGPNCLGFINRPGRIVLIPSPALYTHVPMPKGEIGVVSQSGGLAATLLDIAAGIGLGFSHAVATGNQLDLSTAHFIRFLADDPDTRVICCYLEGARDNQDLLDAFRYARRRSKPIVLLKAGRTAAGSRAAFTHTASMATDYDAFAAYAEKEGVILVNDPKTLLVVAGFLEAYGESVIDDVVMVTNSGGGASIVADRLSDVGVALRSFAPQVAEELRESYFASHARNPLDWGGTDLASEDVLLERSFSALRGEPGNPLILVVFLTNPNMKRTAEILARHVRHAGRPFLFLVVPDKAADVSREVLRAERIPFADGVAETVDAIAILAKAASWKNGETLKPDRPADLPRLPKLLSPEGDEFLQRFLVSYGISVVPSETSFSKSEACAAAERLGFPVALKVRANGLSHKTDVRGVELHIGSEQDVRRAWDRIETGLQQVRPDLTMNGVLVQKMVSKGIEILVGVKNSPGLGPTIVFGAGGTLAELLADIAVLPVPCSVEEVSKKLKGLKIARLLSGYRGDGGSDVSALVDVIVRLSWLAHDLKDELVEVDLNPVIVGPVGTGAVVVDMRARFASSDEVR